MKTSIMYVVYFALLLIVFVEFALLGLVGPLRMDEAIYGWLVYVMLPGLCLASLFRLRPVRDHATAFSLAAFGLAGGIWGLYAVVTCREHEEELHRQVLAVPMETERYVASQVAGLRPSQGVAPLVDSAQDEDPFRSLPIPPDLEARDASRLRLGLKLSGKLLRLTIRDPKHYQMACRVYEESFARDIGEKADRFVRNGRGHQIGIGMILLAIPSLMLAAVLFAWQLTRRHVGPSAGLSA